MGIRTRVGRSSGRAKSGLGREVKGSLMTRPKPVVVPVLVQEVGKIDGSLSRYGVGWHGLAAGLARCGGRFSAGEPRDFEGRQPDCARPLHRADIPLPQDSKIIQLARDHDSNHQARAL